MIEPMCHPPTQPTLLNFAINRCGICACATPQPTSQYVFSRCPLLDNMAWASCAQTHMRLHVAQKILGTDRQLDPDKNLQLDGNCKSFVPIC